MPLHTTKDLLKRCEHITEREDKENFWNNTEEYEWPRDWLRIFEEVQKEILGEI